MGLRRCACARSVAAYECGKDIISAPGISEKMGILSDIVTAAKTNKTEDNLDKYPVTTGIVRNCFMYRSATYMVIPKDVIGGVFLRLLPPFTLMCSVIIIIGYLVRKLEVVHSLAFYTTSILCFSSGLAVQYFAIPLLFISLFPNIFSISYILTGFIVVYLGRTGFHHTTMLYAQQNLFLRSCALAIDTAFVSLFFSILCELRRQAFQKAR